MRAALKAVVATAAALLASAALGAGAATASFGLEEVAVSFEEQGGVVATQAGGHPFQLVTSLSFNSEVDPELGEIPDGAARDLRIDLPVGLAGSPTATRRCSGADFADVIQSVKLPSCANDTAIGVAIVELGGVEEIPESTKTRVVPEYLGVPLYNLQPLPGEAARLGMIVLGVPVTIDLRVSESAPYRVVASSENIPQVLSLYGATVYVWGNPADPSHDSIRGDCVIATIASTEPRILSKGSCSSDLAAARPFLTSPRACAGPLEAVFEADSWQRPGAWARASARTAAGFIECETLSARFGPGFTAQPSSAAGESSSGLDVSIEVADEGYERAGRAAGSDIKRVEVTFPEGVTVNPSQAQGLGVCSEAELGRETASAPPGQGCPESSKVGSLEVETPLLEGELLRGSVFVATPYRNPFNSLIALYLVIKDPELGISIKLPGEVRLDPVSGRIVATFDQLPQLPFSRFRLRLSEGPRAPLVTPSRCGTYTTHARFTPWSDPGASFATRSSFTVGSGPGGGPCLGPEPLLPSFAAGTVNNHASSYSPLAMRFTRNDGQQDITRLSMTLPPGLTGKLAGIPHCPQAAIEAAKARSGVEELLAPSCPPAARIGSTLAGAGVGSELTWVPGSIYLGGPYHGDPLSIAVIVPAVAGPFDIGTVVVQEALDLNSSTAQVEVDGLAADPIPTILEGIPLRLRDLRIDVDRPQFTLNPTSCEPFAVQASVWGTAGAVPLAQRFQAADCAKLGFNPRLSLRLKGGTKRSKHPSLRTTVTYPYESGPGYANIGGATVILPPSQFIDNAHINNPCTRVQFNAEACPKKSVLGYARAVSPLLDAPLEGPVYFRSNGGERELPDIVADLRGQFHIILVGFVDTVTPERNPRIRTRFAQVPDAPVTSFTLNLFGGERGLLVNSRNICSKPQRARLFLTGHNGLRRRSAPIVKTSCGKGKKASRHRRQ